MLLWLIRPSTSQVTCIYNRIFTLASASLAPTPIPTPYISVQVSTLAGQSSLPGLIDGTGTQVKFNNPYAICGPGQGNAYYILDKNNYNIRKMFTNGTVVYMAGSQSMSSGYVDGIATAVLFTNLQDCTLDSQMNVYISILAA